MTYTDKIVTEQTPITRELLPKDTVELSLFLLGQMVVRTLPEGIAGGRIVETEAYPVGDPAAHAYRRMTPRNQSLFMDRGTAYVYRAYGISFMLNVASEQAGQGAGVLIRAVEPEFGLAIMRQNRVLATERDMTRGPGRLAAALAIDQSLDGCDLCVPGPLYLAADARPVGAIGVSPRIGITRAVDAPWRFFLRESRFLSGSRLLNG